MQREMAVFMKGTGAGQQEPQRLVHASIIDPRDIRICKRDGKDWELGAGSFGTVSPGLCVVPVLLGSPAFAVFRLRLCCFC